MIENALFCNIVECDIATVRHLKNGVIRNEAGSAICLGSVFKRLCINKLVGKKLSR
jgi:hypothetical protein